MDLSCREDFLNTQDVVAPRHEGSYQNKIEEDYEDQKLYAIEVKEQLNKLKDELQYAKNAIYSR